METVDVILMVCILINLVNIAIQLANLTIDRYDKDARNVIIGCVIAIIICILVLIH